MIAEAACWWTRWVSVISTSVSPAAPRACSNSSRVEGTGDAAGPLGHVGARRLVHVVIGDDVGDGEASAGAQDAGDFAQDLGLVGGEVDHAV